MKKTANIISILFLMFTNICFPQEFVNDISGSQLTTQTSGWYQISSPTANTLNGLYIYVNTLYAYGNAGSVYRKNDNVLTWKNKSVPSSFSVKGMVGLQTGYFIIGSGGSVYRSVVSDSTWVPYYSTYNPASNPNYNINSLWSTGANYLWIAGDGGNYSEAQNVGQGTMEWLHPPTGTVQNLNSIQGGFFDGVNSILIAVGNNGTIIKSLYPYTSWAIKPSGTTQNLNCIIQVNDASGMQYAIAAGANGTILKSTNFGDTWTQSVSTTTSDLYCVCYSGGIGLACGANGVILRDNFGYTNNRGINWEQQSSPTTQTLYGIAGIYNGEAFAVGAGGIILHTTTGGSPQKLNLTALIQGFYNNVTNKMIKDTATVFLRNNITPYSIVDTAKSILDSAGKGSFFFNKVNFGSSYYIVVKHRNAIETWSSAGLGILDSINYNFTAASSSAFGNNLILKGTKYCIYNGDVNQDGNIDLTDLISIYNDASNFVTGYVVTDLNGDNIVDLTDVVFDFNNSNNFVKKITP